MICSGRRESESDSDSFLLPAPVSQQSSATKLSSPKDGSRPKGEDKSDLEQSLDEAIAR